MSQIDQALTTMTGWLLAALHYLNLLLSAIDHRLHRGLSRLAIPENLQMLLILLIDIFLLIVVVRAFGGIARVFLAVFLILLLLHVAVPRLGV